MATRDHSAVLRQACRLLAACGLAWGGAAVLRLPEAYWAIITAITVMQPDLPHTLSTGRERVVATLVGAACGVALIALRELGLPTLPLFVAALVPLAALTAASPRYRLAGTTLVVVFLIPGAEGDPYLRPLFRVGDILIGALACLATSALVFPGQRKVPATP